MKSYIIDELVIKNIRSYQTENNRLNLSPRLNIIMGANGSGKTTILESLTCALTGKEPESVKRADWANNTINPPFEAGIQLSVKDNEGNKHVIKRFFSFSTNKQQAVSCSATTTEIFDTGADEGLLKYCLFCQEQNADWMFDTDANLFKVFNQLLNTDKYNNFAKQIGTSKIQAADCSMMQEEVQVKHKQVKQLTSKLSKCVDIQKVIQELGTNFNQLQEFFEVIKHNQLTQQEINQIETLKNQTFNSQFDSTQLQAERDVNLKIQMDLKQNSSEIQVLNGEFGKINPIKVDTNQLNEIISQSVSIISDKFKQIQQFEAVTQLLENYRNLTEAESIEVIKIQFVDQIMAQQNKSLQELNNQIQKLNTQQSNVQTEQQRFKQQKQQIDDQLCKIDVVQNSKLEIQQQELLLKQLNVKIQETNQKVNQTQTENKQLFKTKQSNQQIVSKIVQESQKKMFKIDDTESQNVIDLLNSAESIAKSIKGEISHLSVQQLIQIINQLITQFKKDFQNNQMFMSFEEFEGEIQQQVSSIQQAESLLNDQILNKQGLQNNKQLLQFLIQDLKKFLDKKNIDSSSKIQFIEIFQEFVEQYSSTEQNTEVVHLQKLKIYCSFYNKYQQTIQKLSSTCETHDFMELLEIMNNKLEQLQNFNNSEYLQQTNIGDLIQDYINNNKSLSDSNLAQLNEASSSCMQQQRIHNNKFGDVTYIKEFVLSQPFIFDSVFPIFDEQTQNIDNFITVLQEQADAHTQVLQEYQTQQDSINSVLNAKKQELNNILNQFNIQAQTSKEDLQNQASKIDQKVNQADVSIQVAQQQIDQFTQDKQNIETNLLDQSVIDQLKSLVQSVNQIIYSYTLEQINAEKSELQQKLNQSQAQIAQLEQQYDQFLKCNQNASVLKQLNVKNQLLTANQEKFNSLLPQFQKQLDELISTSKQFLDKQDKLPQDIDIATFNQQQKLIQELITKLQERTQPVTLKKDLIQKQTEFKSAITNLSNQLAVNKAKFDLNITQQIINLEIKNYQIIKLDQINQILMNLWNGSYCKNSDLNAIESILLVQQESSIQVKAVVKTARGETLRSVRTGVSSGQRVMISILLRIAFSKAFQTNLRCMCLDEPTNFLDQQNAESLSQMLGDFVADPNNHLQIILVTHSADFKNGLLSRCADAKVFVVENMNAGSRIREIEE
ncbi:RAD50_DNA repair protein [Hexamita inflata]|uniref:Putative n=1 Tax=Hexamita inflata TaxID=28002 RepID=A0AA86R4H3_9EUKA|nr:RAD50 DNA repair protein [Hexamita inflata]